MENSTLTQELISLAKQVYFVNDPLLREANRRAIVQKTNSRFGEYGEDLFDRTKAAFPTCLFLNLTDWEYSVCYSFDIQLAPGEEYLQDTLAIRKYLEEGKQYATFIDVDLSALFPIFFRSFKTYRLSHDGQLMCDFYLEPRQPEHREIANKLDQFFIGCNFRPVDAALLSSKVDSIELTETPSGKVTLYDCFFHDQTGLLPFPYSVFV